MTAPAAPAAPAQPLGSWGRLAVGLSAFLLAPLLPQFRVLLPIEQAYLLLVAALAACAVVGWKNGGSLSLAVVWVGVAALLLASPAGPPDSAYNWMARGWTLLLAAGFGLVSIIVGAEAFFPRALSAMAVATSLAFALVLVTPGGPARVASAIAADFDRRHDESVAEMRRTTDRPEWKELVSKSPQLQRLPDEVDVQLGVIEKWSTVLMPALLALESLAALALGWALFHRLSSVSLGPALGKLRDFRFNDHLIWGVAVGASIFLLDAFAEGKNAGLNLLVFFGFLYLLRGMGILAWLSRSRAMSVLMLAMTFIIPGALPIMAALAFGIGLGDTWLDLRARAQAKSL